MNNDAFSILFGELPQETEVSIEKTQEATPKVSTPVIPEQVAVEKQKTEVQTTLEEKANSPRIFVAPSKQKTEKKKKNKSDFLPL